MYKRQVCEYATVDLFADASGGSGFGYQYFWDFTPDNANVQVSTTTSNLSVDVFALDNNGCSTDTNQITISVLDPISINVNNLDSICLGESYQIICSASGGDGNYVFDWTNNDGSGFSATGASINVSPVVDTEYYIIVSDGCTSQPSIETVNILVNTPPDIVFSADNLEGCYPLTVEFSNNTVGNLTSNCNWTIDGQTFNSCNNLSYTFDQPGCYDISLEATSQSGCINSDTISDMICAYDYPVANFSFEDSVLSVYDPVVNVINESTDNFINQWSVSNEILFSLDLEYNFPESEGLYPVCLEVTNQYGCSDTYCSVVSVLEDFNVYVPNTFTPDQDGDNDYFFPVFSSEKVSEYELLIFNRWGEIIYRAWNENAIWDGTHKGQMVQQDTYVWLLKYYRTDATGLYTTNGHVNVIR